ncbi:MAG: hypothetical protein ACYDEJ_00805 [Desulfitobacteriaceae bacterium]
MDNDRFQEVMLDQFAKLFKEFQGIKEDISGIKEDISGVKEDISGVKEDISGVKEDISGVKEDISGVKEDISGVKELQLRMELKFNEQISALQDFRVSQVQFNQEIKDALKTLGTKIEELQFEARATDDKLDNVSEDINYLARRSLRHERQLKEMKG